MSAWLQKHKKSELQDLADEAGLKTNTSMNKSEMIDSLESHLSKNSSSLKDKPAFGPYYAGSSAHRANSPVKRGMAAAKDTATDAADDASTAVAKKTTKRRQTLNAAAADAAESAKELLPTAPTTRTPSRALQRAAAAIPSSPQAVTSLVERQSAAISKRASQFYEDSGLPALSNAARENLSSARGITLLTLAVEAYAMQRATLPWREAFNVPVPFSGMLNVSSLYTVKFPDFFVLLTSAFWAPVGLWLAISVIAPALLGWLFNLGRAPTARSKHAGTVDVVAFNLARGLAAWLVFVQKWGQGRFVEVGAAGAGVGLAVQAGTVWKAGYIDPGTAGLVDGSIWGGVVGLLVESGVGVLAGLYEAVLRK